jgi:hypothetical protein
MDTRANAIPVFRQEGAHPQALACAACEVRSQALFGVLDDSGLDRIHTQIASVTLQADAPVYAAAPPGWRCSRSASAWCASSAAASMAIDASCASPGEATSSRQALLAEGAA